MIMKSTRLCLLAITLAFSIGCADTPDLSETEALGTIPACSSGTWCAETAPAGTGILRGVSAVSVNDVFAVGNGGLILRRQNGEDWASMTSGTSSNLHAVWATSSSDVWVVGASGIVLHYDGTSWSTNTAITTTSTLNAVWTSSSSDIWIAGGSKTWRSTDSGANFTSTTHAGIVLSISGTSASDVCIAGENGTKVRRWNGSSWTTMSPGANTYFSVLDISTSNIHAAKIDTGTRKWNGSKWSSVAATGAVFSDLYAQSSTDLWGAGGTKIGRNTGSGSWTVTTPFGSSVVLLGVTGVTNNVWVVGSDSSNAGLIEHWAY